MLVQLLSCFPVVAQVGNYYQLIFVTRGHILGNLSPDTEQHSWMRICEQCKMGLSWEGTVPTKNERVFNQDTLSV